MIICSFSSLSFIKDFGRLGMLQALQPQTRHGALLQLWQEVLQLGRWQVPQVKGGGGAMM